VHNKLSDTELWVRWDNFVGKVVHKHYRPPTSVHEEMWVLLVAAHSTADVHRTVRLFSLDYNDIDAVLTAREVDEILTKTELAA
jgi:hypothetical protein